uniref:HAT C-terminal dimerisation domain-containing protein n=1 Tax=Lactuca sativa TaxID=4236 RepID=A0A9R1WSB2_LACSA|nr:hypothetical protein LSAT_V11C900482580 [Lactuca sativa]
MQIRQVFQNTLGKVKHDLIILTRNSRRRYDILTWWKNSAVQFPIVAQMARDILGMQISIVASESTFSNGRRVITDYRIDMHSGWLRKSSLLIYDYDEVHDVLADDDLAIGNTLILVTSYF